MNRAETEREGEGKKKQATKWRGEGRSGGGRAARSIQGGREGLRCGIASFAKRRDPRRKTPPPALRVPLPLGGGEKLAEAGGARLPEVAEATSKHAGLTDSVYGGPLSRLYCYVTSPRLQQILISYMFQISHCKHYQIISSIVMCYLFYSVYGRQS